LADGAAFDVGLAVDADLRLLAGAAAEDVFFLAGDLGFVAGLAFAEPVMVFFAGARLAEVFFAAGLAVFFESGVLFFTVPFFATAALFLGFATALEAAGLATVFLAGAGLFSFAASEELFLGAILTFPEGPLGRTNVPFSAP